MEQSERLAVTANIKTKPRKMDGWSRWAFFLILGYSLQGRSFAYVGIAPAKLFIGEASLLAFLMLKGKAVFTQWFSALTKTVPATALSWCLLLSLFYGIIETVRGVQAGFSPLTAIENLVFNVYPLYLFLGIWAGTRHPDIMLRTVRIFAIFACVYGPLYLLVLNRLHITMPGSNGVPVFSQAGGGSFIVLGLLALDPKPQRYWFPMMVGAFMLLAMQVRSEWLGFGLSVLIWGFLEKKLGKVILIGMGIVCLLAIGFISDVSLPSTAERGGAVSSREIVARGLSAFSQDLAAEYSSTKNVRFYYGTIYWRTQWWHQIWNASNESLTTQVIGPGYGYPLKNLVPSLKKEDIRTPHNVFYFCLGYSGWVGVVLFVALQTCMAQLLWRTYKITGQAFGIASWAAGVTGAFFGNAFETPFGAIPTYLSLGLLMAPALAVANPFSSRVPRPAQLEDAPQYGEMTDHVVAQ